MTTFSIITCAGIGKRMQSEMNKIFLMLDDEPVVARTIQAFQEAKAIDSILLVAREEDISEVKRLVKEKKWEKVTDVVIGGERRQNSVYNGLLSLQDAKANDIVVIHNGVNPFIDEKTIQDSIEAAKKYEAAVVGFRSRDTIKEVDEKGFVVGTHDRHKLWQVQTPQTIRYGTAMRAFKQAFEEEFYGTDDVMLVERLGKRVKMIECPYENIKITLPNDLEFANKMVKGGRIGFGQDSHRFIKEGEKPLVIGGIGFEGLGFDANSDGDIVLHALFNAIAQGLGERSLGVYADDMCEKGITDSKEYLNKMLSVMKDRGYQLGNIGLMIEGKIPKIVPKEKEVKASLSEILGIKESRIGITATTGEELTPFGKGLGMQCFCVITLEKAL